MTRTLALTTLCLSLAGCGLIDSDITQFDLRVSDKEFTVDTAEWELTSEETFPAIDCSDMQGVCSAGIMEACGNEATCFGSCDGQNCQALVLVNSSQTIDLAQERPELREVAKRPVIDVTVERVFYSVPQNTLNVPTPKLRFYVAPPTVTNPGDPQAKLVGEIQPIPAGDTPMDRDILFVEGGELELQEFMGNWEAQFNVIVGGEVTIQAGDPVPEGLLEARVTVDAYADL